MPSGENSAALVRASGLHLGTTLPEEPENTPLPLTVRGNAGAADAAARK